MKKLLAAFLALSSVLTVSCGGDSGTSDDTTVGTSDATTPAETKPAGYQYYDGVDFGGKTFTIFNIPRMRWDMISYITAEEQNGETINDAIFERNSFVQEKLNCTIAEINSEQDTMTNLDELRRMVLADESSVDAAFMPMYTVNAGIAEGMYYELNSVKNLNLGEDYWDQKMLEQTAINGKNYFATGDVHLQSYDGMWCLFFNKDMMDDLGLDYPYDLVREGKWTLDKLEEYSKKAANLNGAESFTMDINSPAIYGTVSYGNVTDKFLHGMQADYFVTDASGKPEFRAQSPAFVDNAQKLAKFFSSEGVYLNADSAHSSDNHFVNFFYQEKALFLGVEINIAVQMRDKDFEFGIVPMPKASADQDGYYSTVLFQCGSFTIPATNKKPEDVALLMDALCYESTERVVEPYLSELVEQKGLRDDDSIEMLKIARAGKSFDIGVAYQWVGQDDLGSAMRSEIVNGGTGIVSTIEANKNAVLERMNKTLEYFK